MRRSRGCRLPDAPVFLIGSGAVFDAGLPGVYDLSTYLLRRLSNHDRTLVGEVSRAVRTHHAGRRLNIEHLLDAIELVRSDSGMPWLKALLRKDLQHGGNEFGRVAVMIKRETAKLFLRLPSPASIKYVSRLLRFKPSAKPLHIFTTNFDLCIEQALKDAGVNPNVEMGSEGLMPISYHLAQDQVNLFKLHGSVDWFDVTDFRPSKPRGRRETNEPYDFSPHLGIQFPQIHDWNPELSAIEIRRLFRSSAVEFLGAIREACPQIVLGTLEKVLSVNPYQYLLECFRTALRTAGVLVVVGYGWGDRHLNRVIIEAWLRSGHRLKICVVSPDVDSLRLPVSRRFHVPYHKLKMTARKALETGALLRKLNRMVAYR